MAIYARLENGTYAEVTGVYKTDGTEVTEIFQGDRLVYSASNEIYGSLPLYYNGKGYDLTDYLISGNAVQDGTPSADAPVEVLGCGVRTAQLIPYPFYSSDGEYAGAQFATGNGRIIANGTLTSGLLYYLWRPEKFPAGTYTMSVKGKHTGATIYFRDVTNSVSVAAIYGAQEGDRSVTFTVTEEISAMVYINAGSGSIDFDCTIMLNAGEEALSFEPTNGYKLPLTVNSLEYPIYLGTVPTTRRIKKLVLTGEENWNTDTYLRFSIYVTGIKTSASRTGQSYCSHYECLYHGEPYDNDWNNVYYQSGGTLFFHDRRFATVADWKSYLAAQYAAGTPVTVWYVLAEPETGIVNEPLMKIGDYADTISFAQAGVTIPTVNGANVLDMTSPVKPSEMYIKGKGIKPTGYGQLTDVNGVNILDKDGKPIHVHGQ